MTGGIQTPPRCRYGAPNQLLLTVLCGLFERRKNAQTLLRCHYGRATRKNIAWETGISDG
eukprot:7220216-Lingulodinium_polyedra.AAC.1